MVDVVCFLAGRCAGHGIVEVEPREDADCHTTLLDYVPADGQGKYG